MAIIVQEIVKTVLPITGFLPLGTIATVTVLGTPATGFASLQVFFAHFLLLQNSADVCCYISRNETYFCNYLLAKSILANCAGILRKNQESRIAVRN